MSEGRRNYTKGWAKYHRLPSYWFNVARMVIGQGRTWKDWWYWTFQCKCPCVDGSNDFYWNGWFKKPKDCSWGG